LWLLAFLTFGWNLLKQETINAEMLRPTLFITDQATSAPRPLRGGITYAQIPQGVIGAKSIRIRRPEATRRIHSVPAASPHQK